MNDLISRQAAIEAIRASTSKYNRFFMGMEMYTDDDAVEAIEGLPPAQQWIPVSEKMPEERKKILCQCRAGIMMVLRWQENAWYQDVTHRYLKSFVLAWMPLPEPYAPTQSNDSKALDSLEGKGAEE